MPLINKGQEVRFMFDGWPSIVFSGWPNSSYGTVPGGEVVAIDNFISPKGNYRILVAPAKDEGPWPRALRVGGGAVEGLALARTLKPSDVLFDPSAMGYRDLFPRLV